MQHTRVGDGHDSSVCGITFVQRLRSSGLRPLGDVHGDGSLGREARDVVRPPAFGPVPESPIPPKGCTPTTVADDRAVDVDIACPDRRFHFLGEAFERGVHAERKAVALGGEFGADGFDVVGVVTDDVEDGTEDFLVDQLERGAARRWRGRRRCRSV